MHLPALDRAVALAEDIGHVFVATADRNGFPHVAAAGKLDRTPEGKLLVAAWFCPETLANLRENRRLALVIWDPRKDEGYQLVGESEEVVDLAMMDGMAPGKELSPLPQVERQISLRVDKILEFKHAPHSDLEKSS